MQPVKPLQVLIVEDSADDAELILLELRRGGFEPSWERVEDAAAMRDALERRPWEVVLSDYTLPTFDAVAALGVLRLWGPEVPFLVVSGTIGEELAVQVVKAGADDYLLKSSLVRLAPAVTRALREAESRRTHRAAQQEISRLAAIVQSSEDAIIGLDLEGTVTNWNPAAEHLYGWPAAEAVGRPASFLVPPDRMEELTDIFGRLRRGERVRHHETVRLHREGTRLDVSLTVSPVYDGEGRLVGASKTARDITERRKAEEARLKLEAQRDELLRRLQLQIERMPLACIQLDADLRITGWNPAAEKTFGFTREEVLGVGPPFAMLVPPEDAGEVDAVLGRIKAGESFIHSINANRTRDGRRIICEWFNTPVRDAGGTFLGQLILGQDITACREAEEQALRLGRHLRLLLESTGEGIWGLDEHGRCSFINRAGAAMLGYSPEEVVGKDMHALVHHSRPDGCLYPFEDCPIYAAFREGKGVRLNDEVLWRKDGNSFPAALTSYPVVEKDFRGAVVTFSDITESKRLEEQYRQAQKMEAVGRLAGGVAHDFNNLLTVINGYSEILMARLKPQDPEWGLLDEIRKAGERSAALTRQLLAFSRKQVVAPRVLDLNAVVGDMEKMLRRIIGEDIQLSVALHPKPARILADPGQLEQVLLNLAVNARGAMPEGGKLTIETAEADNCSDAEDRDGPWVLLTVTDTGCGMPPEVQARVFEPFFTTKAVGEGTGLGLATVYGIVQQAGGHIRIDSAPGRGSAFRLYFPQVREGVAKRSSQHRAASSLRGNETILLVEDEDGVRSLIRHLLQQSGYAVLEAADGAEALQVCKGHREHIHLLLTDVVTPGALGVRQLAEEVCTRHPETRVLYVSGYTEDAVLRRGIASDEVAFLEKPFSALALVQKVREVLDAPEPAGVAI